MALSGIQIFKQLPKTNCKDCGYATCMAFALQLAAGRVSLEACPHLAPDVAAALQVAATPPVRKVTLGRPEGPIILGEETVLYRHEKRFEHAPALAFMVDDDLDDTGVARAIAAFREHRFERVGESLSPRMMAVASTDSDRLLARAKQIAAETDAGLIIVSDRPATLRAVGTELRSVRPLLCGAALDIFTEVLDVAQELDAPFVVRGESLDELEELGRRTLEAGAEQVLLEPVVATAGDALRAQIFARRAALRSKGSPLGFPVIAFPCRLTADPMLQTVLASALIAKYAGVVVVDPVDPAHTLALLSLAQGLYTDPQKPMMVEAGIYPVGEPGPDSPVMLTTNFSLTYYTVVGEIESSKIPAWLMVMDVEGQSVLTAWAAGKFVADAIGPFVKKSRIEDKVDHRRLIIPGYVANIRDELETELGDWEVVVGVREAADIPRYLRTLRERG
ncbi:MAG: acetyl-CoA decarbonylase/synthase complex subunit gamma [Thermoleophilia bacterium]|jgi:acetyl-CoA decarbonylase/synthase complex subunit gamma